MPKSINLLTSDFKEPKSYKFVSKTSIIILSVYIVILVLVFGASFFLNTQKNKQTARVNELITSIQQKKESEELLVTLKNRVSVAQTLYAKGAPSPSELINRMVALLPQGVSLLNLTVGEGGEINMVVTADSSTGIAEFLNKVKGGELTSVIMNTLTLNSDGEYVVSLNIRP